MKMKRGAVIIGLMAVASGACGGDSPSAPTTLSNSLVTVFQDPEYRGGSRALMVDVPDLDALSGPCGAGVGGHWNDCISSIRIPSGWEVTLFQDKNYGGTSSTATADIQDLERRAGPCGDGWDDCVSSIRVRQR